MGFYFFNILKKYKNIPLKKFEKLSFLEFFCILLMSNKIDYPQRVIQVIQNLVDFD